MPQPVVNARDLWAGLEVKTEFAKWLERRITANDEFESGLDYEADFGPPDLTNQKSGRGGNRKNIINCVLSVNTARKGAMAEGGTGDGDASKSADDETSSPFAERHGPPRPSGIAPWYGALSAAGRHRT